MAARKKNRDVKFIIYQSLYIFVICVIALKGANLDLTEVINKDKVVEKSYADSLKAYLDSLLALGLVPKIEFDTTNISKIDPNLIQQLQQKIQVMQTQVTTTNPNVSMNTQTPQVIQQEQKKPEEIKKDPGEMQEIRIGNIILYQYTQNTLSNPYDTPLEIVGITTIPAKSTKTFETGGQGSVTIKVGSSSKTVELRPNDKPKVSISRVTNMGENVSVRTLQSVTGFRVVISDDFPGQLDVKFNGPIEVKNAGQNTYDITLKAFGSKSAFDNFSSGKDSPYSIGFTVTVKDKIAGHTVTGQQSFIFGDW
ncbi:MAG: hypothetical protein JSS63_09715 [Bacteroidetes bacterium]|nr:hypothetical protein [Bacteroidota bacterium]MBX7046784.1 hypothetical protein [Ignavibacteria bacterium]